MRLVSLAHGADNAPVRAYARRVGLPPRRLPYYHGTATSWQNHRAPDTTAFVVELPAGRLSRRAARRHARAVLAASPRPRRAAAAPKPPIEWDPIPFGADRKRQMRRYSRRHYGEAKARLVEPKVIVEHYTASSSFSSAFETFAANAPDVEFGERPGVCAHYLIDRDGTIHQLVSLRWRCRHTVGLNDSAIGIEHVGVSDADVMGRPRQLAASLRADALAPGPLRHPRARRDRARREPLEPVSPRARPRRCATAPTATSRRRRCGATAAGSSSLAADARCGSSARTPGTSTACARSRRPTATSTSGPGAPTRSTSSCARARSGSRTRTARSRASRACCATGTSRTSPTCSSRATGSARGSGGGCSTRRCRATGVRITFASGDERALPLYVRAGLRPLAPLLYLEGPRDGGRRRGAACAWRRPRSRERDAAASGRERPELLAFLAEAGAYALAGERPGAYAIVRPAPAGAWLGPAAADAGELLAFAGAATRRARQRQARALRAAPGARAAARGRLPAARGRHLHGIAPRRARHADLPPGGRPRLTCHRVRDRARAAPHPSPTSPGAPSRRATFGGEVLGLWTELLERLPSCPSTASSSRPRSRPPSRCRCPRSRCRSTTSSSTCAS